MSREGEIKQCPHDGHGDTMTATLTIDCGTNDVECGTTVEAAVRASGKNPDAYIFLVSGTPVPMDTPIEDGMAVKAVRVASGG
jgi:sulfur carrier protein